MTDELLEEMGPIDYIVLEWPGRQPKGDVAPLIIDLVDRGHHPDSRHRADGQGRGRLRRGASTSASSTSDAGFGAFEGASSGPARPGGPRGGGRRRSSPARRPRCWCGRTAGRRPIAVAIRKSGGQLVASGRIPVQAILAALEAIEPEAATT